MGVFIKIILAITALASMSLSSFGFKSDNFIVGFIFVLISIISFIFLLRFLWTLIGCFMTLGLIVGFVALILYVTGSFSGEGLGLQDKVLGLLSSNKVKEEEHQTLYGQAIALTGETFQIGSETFYLYGISSPYLQQTCTNSYGGVYKCGEMSKNYLGELLEGKEPVCTIVNIAERNNNNTPVICNIGEYDLGALMVASGWSIPDIAGGRVYIKYEQEAKKRKVGMWQGKFYSPWEWSRIQTDTQKRMDSIKVEEPKSSPSLLMQNFLN